MQNIICNLTFLIAGRKGKTVEEYVREMIETEILAAKPFDEILAPIRQGFPEEQDERG